MVFRWKAAPLRLEEWKAWFQEQAKLANASLERGLYVSLRLDGRVRGSGLGPPPWQRLVAQLAPVEGDAFGMPSVGLVNPTSLSFLCSFSSLTH